MKQHNLLNGIRSTLAAFALIWALPSQATDVRLVNWGMNIGNSTFGDSSDPNIDLKNPGRLEMKQIVIDNNVDFAFYIGSGSNKYFVYTPFGDYISSVFTCGSSTIARAYLFHNDVRWSLCTNDYYAVRTWGVGSCFGKVLENRETLEQYACVFCFDNFGSHSDVFSKTVAGIVKSMTNDYPNARVLVSYNAAKITAGDMPTGLSGMGLDLVVKDSVGGVYTTGDVQPTSAVSSTLSGTVYTATSGFMATMTYPSKYRVEFRDWDESLLGAPQIVDEGDPAVPPEDPERAGYEFIGWDRTAAELASVTTSMVVHAQYKLLDTNYNVTFNDWDDSLIDQVPVPKNTPVGRPADPTRQYYTFRAWKNGDVDWNFADPVASNMTLKADYALNAVNDIGDAASLAAIFAAGLPDSVIIRLTNDINVASVAYTPADFSGILDGNGHYITGLPNDGKLFVTLSGTVHDLTLKDIGTGATIGSNGGILATSAVGATVYNCVIENANRVHSTSNVQCGGMFQTSNKNANNQVTVISNCVVRNSRIVTPVVRDSQYAGGFVAVANYTDFVDCRFETTNATSTAVGDQATYAAGIVAKSTAGVTVKRCSAQGVIKADKYVSYEFGGASGIIGYACENVTIVDCTNDAKCVTASGNGAGGIIGHVYGNSKRFEVVGAVNRGAIVVAPGSNTGRGGGAGGIVGGSYGGTNIRVVDSANYGEVVSSDFAGGILGNLYASNTSCSLLASNVFNYASITADGACGGIMGNSYGSYGSRILNVGNAGTIASTAGAAGGILGKITTYGNTDRTILDGIMQNGQVTTASGCASLGIGTLDSMTWSNNALEFRSAVMAGSAAATDGGQVGSLCGGFIVVSTSKAVTFSADANCRLLGTYSTTYYDYQGQPQTLDITAMTAADLKSKSGSVKLLNDNATAKGYVAWVQGENYPELSLFAQEVVKSTGLTIFFR